MIVDDGIARSHRASTYLLAAILPALLYLTMLTPALGAASTPTAADPTPLWRADAPHPDEQTELSLGSDYVLLTTYTLQTVTALDLNDGSTRWSLDFSERPGDSEDSGFSSSPIITDGRIFLPTRGFGFVAIDSASGDIVWERTAEAGSVWETPIPLTNDTVVTAYQNVVSVLDVDRGDVVWETTAFDDYNPNSNYAVDLAVAGDQVLLTTSSGRLYAFDPGSGEPLWNRNLGEVDDMEFLAGTDAIIVRIGGERLVRYDANGNEMWAIEGEQQAGSPVGLANSRLLLSDGSRLLALDTDSGKVAWEQETGAYGLPSAIVSGNAVTADCQAGDITAYNLQSGTETFRSAIAPTARCSIQGTSAGVLVHGTPGRLEVLDASTGEIRPGVIPPEFGDSVKLEVGQDGIAAILRNGAVIYSRFDGTDT